MKIKWIALYNSPSILVLALDHFPFNTENIVTLTCKQWHPNYGLHSFLLTSSSMTSSSMLLQLAALEMVTSTSLKTWCTSFWTTGRSHDITWLSHDCHVTLGIGWTASLAWSAAWCTRTSPSSPATPPPPSPTSGSRRCRCAPPLSAPGYVWGEGH